MFGNALPFASENYFFKRSYYPLSDEVASFLKDQEFYWSVKGVASEQELVDELISINPPAPPISRGGGKFSVGCFVKGAGRKLHCSISAASVCMVL